MSCTNCGSRSGVHTDPDKDWCFACHTKSGKGKSMIDKPRKELALPTDDVSDYLPKEALKWLYKYFKDTDIVDCFWSNDYQRLCFPYYIDGTMRGCWLRDVMGLSDKKWLFAGKKDFTWFLTKASPPSNNKVVLVEDVVSAIRVSKHSDCICLGGTSINEYVSTALRYYNKVDIFLDPDDAGVTGAKKIRNQLKLTHEVRVIRANRDPKEFDDKWLEEILK